MKFLCKIRNHFKRKSKMLRPVICWNGEAFAPKRAAKTYERVNDVLNKLCGPYGRLDL